MLDRIEIWGIWRLAQHLELFVMLLNHFSSVAGHNNVFFQQADSSESTPTLWSMTVMKLCYDAMLCCEASITLPLAKSCLFNYEYTYFKLKLMQYT